MRKVIFDAGHGGHDSGAVGWVLGVRESDINLLVAKLCVKYANLVPDLTALLTRETDEFVPLSTRCRIANEKEADIFASIHCNSCSNDTVKGVETFYYPGSADGYKLSLSLHYSLYFALDELNGDELAVNRGVKTADFYVLGHTHMPAALMELGFISNEFEEALLVSAASQERIASAIVAGVLKYFDDIGL